MDFDPAVRGELDSFSLILPLPFRLSLLVVAGVWLWALNLQGLRLLNIEIAHLIRYPSRSSNAQMSHHHSTYRFAILLTLPLIASIVLFWTTTQGESPKVIAWSIIPNLYLIYLFLAFVVPLRPLPHGGRLRFWHTLRRISLGGLARAEDGKFGDVLLADALTSYAKPLSELFVTLCMVVTRNPTTSRPDRHCGGVYVVPLVMCIPFLIRLRQCVSDRQYLNALKYATAFPAIALSAVQRDIESVGMRQEHLSRLWIFAVTVNSLYSFYWDVARDWDLTLFSADRTNPSHPYGLRKSRNFSNEAYYSVVAVDLILRCTWSLKLSVHLEHFNDVEGGIFFLEFLEIFRRWVWVFFRAEAESIRARANGDVLLDDLGPKLDED